MADASVTVDELAIKIVAEATTAAASIDTLTASLTQLGIILGPVLTKMGALATATGRLNASAMKAATRAGSAAKASTAAIPMPASSIAGSIPPYLMAQPKLERLAPNVVPGIPSINLLPQQVKETTAAFSKMRPMLDFVDKKVGAVTSSLVRMGKEGPKHVSFLRQSFIQLRSVIFFVLFSLGLLIGAFKGTIGAATDFIEVLNLFQVAMRNNLDAANAFVKAMSNAFGLDPSRIMRYQSTFFQIAESIGLTNKNAYALSEILTRLTFDFASLRNMALDEVFTKLQGVLTGQDRAVRALGGSIQMATLAELAHELGIRKKVQEMTQAEKVLLRLIAIYRQSAIAQGDMARTLLQPANLMRVLGDQVRITARNLGAIFIPAIQAVLPYIIYFVRAIGMLATSIASFFGVNLAEMSFAAPDMSFSETLGDNMERTEAAANGAAAAVKQMRDYTLGIDELNIIKPEDPSGGGGGGGGQTIGGGAGDLTDLIEAMRAEMDKLLDTPFADLMKKIGDKVKAAAKHFAPFIKAVKDAWEAFKPFASDIWDGFIWTWENVLLPLGDWVINVATVEMLERLTDALNWFNEHPEVGRTIGGILAVLVALRGLDFIGKIVGWIINLGIGVLGLKKYFGWLVTGVGFVAAVLGLLPGTVVAVAIVIGLTAWQIVKHWDTIKTKAGELWGWLKYWWNKIVDAISEAVVRVVLAVIDGWNWIKTQTKTAWELLQRYVVNPLTNIWNAIRNTFDKIKKQVRGVWDGLSHGLSGAWTGIRNLFHSGVNALIRILNGLIRGINKVIDGMNLINPFKRISRIGEIQELGSTALRLQPHMAKGGSVDEGQLFRAGEAGAELIGSYQSKTTVMPLENSGFVEAMAAAVYGAVTSAMGDAESGGDGNVYIDGQKVGQVLRDNDRRRGVSSSLVRVGS